MSMPYKLNAVLLQSKPVCLTCLFVLLAATHVVVTLVVVLVVAAASTAVVMVVVIPEINYNAQLTSKAILANPPFLPNPRGIGSQCSAKFGDGGPQSRNAPGVPCSGVQWGIK